MSNKLTPVRITIFNGEGSGKRPYSPYKDKTFLFITKSLPSLKEAFQFMSKQYSLSKPLVLLEPVRKKRQKVDLAEYAPKKIKNIAVDLDEITNKEDYIECIEYFKEKNYSIILGKSRSWDGKKNFNLKGIMRVNFTNDEEIIKSALTQLQTELGDKCKVDLTVGNMVSLQAPSGNSFIVHYQEKGFILSDSNVYIEDIKTTLGGGYVPTISYDNKVIDECISIFSNLGYSPTSGAVNDNGSINFQHPSERKSTGGYFWYSTNPLVMHHNNKDRTLSVFHILKETEAGKDWLKSKTKEEQKSQLIKPHNTQNYKSFLYVNERYLDFSKTDKIDMIDEFLDDDRGVLKIKSAMGSAKSAGIDLCIKKAHERKERVILVSNRVSVAEDFADKYNLMIYKNPDSMNHDGSLVVQYDSLHRYNLKKYDVVIFDEFASLLLHHRAGLTDNANVNAVKFKILMENKKVLVADAFLTGYEDIFFKDRNLYAIMNEYKDDIKLFEYKNKEFFVSSIIDKANDLIEGEHISASFTSLNIMRVVEMELKEKGIRVVTLSSETSQLTRDIIYKKFKEDTHGAFQVILFTPTLTVGVSNLNNVKHHFHYDSGMSTDVISSLQMIKRSRTTQEIHYCLEERQFYYDTDIKSINSAAEKNIQNFYNKKDKTLLIDICYKTGDLRLTPLAIYINEIEVFYNILANNHSNAFKLLLNYQFQDCAEIVDEIDNSFTVREKVKQVKDKIKVETLRILDEYSDVTWTSMDLDNIRNKISDLDSGEKAKLLMGTVQSKFRKEIPRTELLELTEIEIGSDFKFASKVKNMRTALKSANDEEYAKYVLSKAISSDIGSLQNKSHAQFLEYLLLMGQNASLKNGYSRNEIKKIDENLQQGRRFEKFLKKIGYSWGEAKLKVDPKVIDYIKYL